MSHSQLAAIVGTVLSSGGTAAAVVLYLRAERKRCLEECEKRFAALREGVKLGAG